MISVVVPILNEEENLRELRRRVVAALDRCGEPWEFILVDDGSRDATSRLLAQMHEQDSRIKAVVLSRTFGHQPAISAGLHHARGDCVIVLDGDLQDPPELISEFLAKWRAGFQVVVGERRTRADRGARGAGFRFFYPAFRWFSGLSQLPDAGIFGLMDRVVVDAIQKLPERNRFMPGLRSWVGFRQSFVSYDRARRAAGKPKQAWSQLMRYATDAIVGFSFAPLRLATLLGTTISVLSFVLGIVYFGELLLRQTPFSGFTTAMICVLFLGGVQLLCVGILGEYLGRIYDEVRGRPLYVVDRTLGIDLSRATDHSST